ncbi:MAG: 23S rRNA (guanosine(2251)-2'-O)-methyltransferase RlmB [Pseudomonadota bacterium]
MQNKTLPTCWIGGIHAVRSAIQHGRVQRLIAVARRPHQHGLITQAQQRGIPVEYTDMQALQRQLGSVNHQGIAAQVELPPVGNETTLDELLSRIEQPPLLLVLDRVTDPHNLGACFRVADAVGADAVLVPNKHSVGRTPAVCKVASGAAATVCFIQVTNLVRTLQRLQQQHGLMVSGLAEDSEVSLYQADLTGPLALVLGSEGQGLRRLTRTCCDQLLRLPMQGQVESLNVSVAAGVCLYEALRQRS